MTRMRRLRGWLAPMLAALALSITVPTAAAQTALPAPQPKSTPTELPAGQPDASPEDLQMLLQTLRDPVKRDELAKQIETLLAVQQPKAVPEEQRGLGARVLGALSGAFLNFSELMEQAGRS